MNQDDFIKHLTAESLTADDLLDHYRRNSFEFFALRIDMQRSLDDGTGYTMYCTLWPKVNFILLGQTTCPILRTDKSYYLEIELVFKNQSFRKLDDTTHTVTYIYEVL